MIIIFSFNISLTRFFQELKSIPDQQVSLCECFASFGQIQGRSCFSPQEKIQRFLSFELTLAVVFQLSLLLFFRFLSGHSLFCLRMPRQSKKMVTPVRLVVRYSCMLFNVMIFKCTVLSVFTLSVSVVREKCDKCARLVVRYSCLLFTVMIFKSTVLSVFTLSVSVVKEKFDICVRIFVVCCNVECKIKQYHLEDLNAQC